MANKRQRKKRMKKKMKLMEQMKDMEQIQLIEVAPVEHVALIDEPEEFIKPWVNPVIIDSGANASSNEYPPSELYLGKYEEENKEYQALLDKRYPEGRIKPIERFVTQEAIILHRCDKCKEDFYGKPRWILGKDHQKHLCSMPYGDRFGNRLSQVSSGRGSKEIKVSKTLNKKGKQQIIDLYNKGEFDNVNQLAKYLNLSHGTVKYHLQKSGLM
jgi:hypothetical protein